MIAHLIAPSAELTARQHVRRYASEAPQSGGSNSVLYLGAGAAALAGGYFYLRQGTPTGQAGAAPPSEEAKKIPAVSNQPGKAAFTGGEQGFLSLLLKDTEIVNHNTKKLTFALPEDDMESGLPVASAVITKYKGPEMQKPVIRPYTPISEVGA
jgi:cytochrome-b5 reductase